MLKTKGNWKDCSVPCTLNWRSWSKNGTRKDIFLKIFNNKGHSYKGIKSELENDIWENEDCPNEDLSPAPGCSTQKGPQDLGHVIPSASTHLCILVVIFAVGAWPLVFERGDPLLTFLPMDLKAAACLCSESHRRWLQMVGGNGVFVLKFLKASRSFLPGYWCLWLWVWSLGLLVLVELPSIGSVRQPHFMSEMSHSFVLVVCF